MESGNLGFKIKIENSTVSLVLATIIAAIPMKEICKFEERIIDER